jgi:branched-chain amino acid transport system substrate-binding protein
MSPSHKLRKGMALLLASLSLTNGLLAQPAIAAEKQIKIAFQGPLSGPEAAFGLEQLQAVEYMVKKFNQKNSGKIKVEIVQVDDQGDPFIAEKIAPLIASDSSIIGLIGSSYSGATSASLPFYKDSSLVMISPSATNPLLTDPTSSRYGAPIFHRVAQMDDKQAVALVKLTKEGISAPKTYLITDEQDFPNMEEKLLKSGLSPIANVKVSSSSQDYSSTVQDVLLKNPTTLVLTGYFPATSKIVSQLREAGYKNRIVMSDASLSSDFIRLTGAKKAEGVFLTTTFAPPRSLPIELQFDYKNTTGTEIPEISATALDASKIILECIGKGNSSRTTMLNCVKKYSGKSITGESISFDANGDIVGASFPRVIIKDGEFAPVTASDLNPNLSTVKPVTPAIIGFTFVNKKLSISVDISKGITPDSVYLQFPSISSKKIFASIKGKVATFAIPLTKSMYGESLAYKVVSAKKSTESQAYTSSIEVPTENSGAGVEATRTPGAPKNLLYSFTEKGHGITVEVDGNPSSRAGETFLYSTDLGISKAEKVKGKTVGAKSVFRIDVPASLAGKKLIVNIISTNAIGESKSLTSIIFPKAESSTPGAGTVACRKASQVRTFEAATCPPGWSKT